MKRRKDWERRGLDYLEKVNGRKFRYGRFDCCIFAANMVKATTGQDPMRDFRGKYTSEESAKKALKEIGSGTLCATLRSIFGNPVPGAMGFRFDVAYLHGQAGVILGKHAAFFNEDGMLARWPINTPDLKAFRVPF